MKIFKPLILIILGLIFLSIFYGSFMIALYRAEHGQVEPKNKESPRYK